MYKKVWLIFLTFFISLCARNAQETFLRANKLYEEKEYIKALQEYQTIEKKGPAVYYNMGNCYYHIGNETQALICYKRARKYAKNNLINSCNYNIDLIEQSGEESHFSWLIALFNKQINRFSLLIMQLFFLVLWLLFCWAFYTRKKTKNKIMVYGSFLLLVPLSLLLYGKYKSVSCSKGIVHFETPLYAGPNAQYHVRKTLLAMQEVEIQQEKDKWFKIRYNKNVGWIPKDVITKI